MKHLLSLFLALLTLGGMAQQANVTLDVKPSDGQRQVRQDYTLQQAQTTFKNWYARAKVLGWTDVQFLDQSMFVAKWQQLQYFTSPLGTNAPTASTVNVTVPEGEYYVNATCELGYGSYKGAGTFVYYPGNYSTTISVWHGKWIGTGPRDLFHTAMWGTNVEGSYAESFRFEGFRLDGKAATAILPDPNYISTGIAVFDAGETSYVNYLYIHSFNNIGAEFIRGTPATGETITVFNNCQAGVMLTGTAGNTFNFGTISGDDNGALVEMRAGWGREPGGQLEGDVDKSEAGVTPISRNPHRKQKLMVLRGQFGGSVGVVRGSHNQVTVENLIEVDCRLTDGTKQVSNLVINSINGFNYVNVLKDLANGWTAKSPGNFKCYELHYTSEFGGKMWNPFFTFEGAPGGTVTPPVTPPVNPPTTGTAKWSKTYTSPTTVSTKVAVPSGVNPIQSTKLNVTFSGTGFKYVNSHLFWGQGSTLWTMTNGAWVDTGIKVTAGQVLNVTVPMPNTTLTNVIGGAGSTAVFVGTIECF